MTFEDIVADVCARMNIHSDEGVERIGNHVNRRYRRLITKIGLNVFRRITVEFTPTVDTREQTITGIEKITAIFGPIETDETRPLGMLSYDEMLELVPFDGDPNNWAEKRRGSSSVTFTLDSTCADPSPDTRTLLIEGEENASTLSGAQIPAFSESYHDILVLQATADELRKAEKRVLAKDIEDEAETLISELRLKIAVGAYQDIIQGKGRTRTNPRINPSVVIPV